MMTECADIVVGEVKMEMNKERFLKFMVDEIERNQKEMYKTGEGKKIVENLIQIYTLVSDGKFDVRTYNAERVPLEIKLVHSQRDNHAV
jgi:hypothetical protein